MNIEGYDKYVVFEDGVIINMNRGKILKPQQNKRGYMKITLYGEKRKTLSIHRVLALAYIPNPEDKPEVDHKNRINNDNRLENLRWATHIENMENKNIYKNNKSKLQHIYKTKIGYRFFIKRKGIKFSKRFKLKEDAIKFRDNYLSKL